MSSQDAFKDGVAVVTGAASGIGLALAAHAATLGMKVALADISAAGLEEAARGLREEGADVLAIPTDVSSAASVDELAETVHRRWGPATLLVNNAGIETTGYLWEIPLAQWNRTVGVYISGPFHGIRSFLPAMLSSGLPGHVLNVASVGGLGVGSLQVPYITSKHAVLAMTESLHQEMQLVGSDVGVSALLPGPVRTRIFETASSAGESDSAREHLEEMRHLLGDAGMSPAEVARIAFAGISCGELWIHTHPAVSDAIIRMRMTSLLDRVPQSASAGRSAIDE
ncbi:SDR family NAD(P)-dependent oxidoreductase [Nocardia jiangxiensis]|uniref:SDR family NAD(P)-dependent oxidoreductase n=1 Tax=Nocardia jiangxiensis TaxID=282685 RepID=A0ABW6S205_9NOCA